MTEVAQIIYIVTVTVLANVVRHRLSPRPWAKLLYAIVLMLLAAATLIAVREMGNTASAMTVILAGVAVFWFAILASRPFVVDGASE